MIAASFNVIWLINMKLRKILFLLLFSVLIPISTLLGNDCPHGEIDCFYPGACARYIDKDNDGICDHSQTVVENNKMDAILALTKSDSNDKTLDAIEKTNNHSERVYHFLPISLFLIILYTTSHILSKKKIIRVVNHRKIWNILLLITFLISGILGVLLVIEINFTVTIPLGFNMLFWHVESGIAMFVITLFHIYWHRTYFKNIFKYRSAQRKRSE